MKILFFNTGKAYLPELIAYKNYFGQHGYICEESKNVNCSEWGDFPIHWHMMGSHFRFNNEKRPKVLIHEYHSASTGRTARIKNCIKRSRLVSHKPDARVFLSSFLENYFSFGDDVKVFFRDMGYYDDLSYRRHDLEKKYDFIYIGSMGKKRKLEPLLDYFKGVGSSYNLCMLGAAEPDLVERYSCHNIIFPGKVPYENVSKYLAESKCAINYIPDDFPYNMQTSTKFIEYIGADINIASTRYNWAKSFSRENELTPYFFNQDMSDFSAHQALNNITGQGKIREYQWNNILDNTRLLEYFKKMGC